MFDNNDSSDDDDDGSLSKQVLPTNENLNEPIDMDKMPTTGEEYLRQVRFQASRLPDFQTATNTKKNTSKSSNSKKHAWHKLFSSTTTSDTNVTTKHIVSMDWQNEQCKAFSDSRNDYFPMRDLLRIRNKKSKGIKLKNANNYWKFCFGNDVPCQSSLKTEDYSLPTMTKMITLTQPQLHELLQHEIDWLEQCGCSIHLALYTFATLAAIEKPISEDVMYTIRQTCLAWKQTRTKLLSSIDSENSIDDSLIKSCDLFVCIIGRYFGQFDLADATD